MKQIDIKKSLEALNRSAVILYPTDTVWGLGCDAVCTTAVERIYAIKRRCETRAMLVLVDSLDMLAEYVEHLPDVAIHLIEKSTRPLTIIYPDARNLASNLFADDGSVGIRIVNEPFCRRIIKKFGKPIVSTSANISGEPAPATFDEICAEIRAAVDYVVEWRQDDQKRSAPSSIIKLNKDGSFFAIR